MKAWPRGPVPLGTWCFYLCPVQVEALQHLALPLTSARKGAELEDIQGFHPTLMSHVLSFSEPKIIIKKGFTCGASRMCRTCYEFPAVTS